MTVKERCVGGNPRFNVFLSLSLFCRLVKEKQHEESSTGSPINCELSLFLFLLFLQFSFFNSLRTMFYPSIGGVNKISSVVVFQTPLNFIFFLLRKACKEACFIVKYDIKFLSSLFQNGCFFCT